MYYTSRTQRRTQPAMAVNSEQFEEQFEEACSDKVEEAYSHQFRARISLHPHQAPEATAAPPPPAAPEAVPSRAPLPKWHRQAAGYRVGTCLLRPKSAAVAHPQLQVSPLQQQVSPVRSKARAKRERLLSMQRRSASNSQMRPALQFDVKQEDDSDVEIIDPDEHPCGHPGCALSIPSGKSYKIKTRKYCCAPCTISFERDGKCTDHHSRFCCGLFTV